MSVAANAVHLHLREADSVTSHQSKWSKLVNWFQPVELEIYQPAQHPDSSPISLILSPQLTLCHIM